MQRFYLLFLLYWQSIDLRLLYPSLCDMEYDLPKFISERVKKTQTPRHLIMEIDSQPDPPPRPKPAKLKTSHLRSSSPFVQVIFYFYAELKNVLFFIEKKRILLHKLLVLLNFFISIFISTNSLEALLLSTKVHLQLQAPPQP